MRWNLKGTDVVIDKRILITDDRLVLMSEIHSDSLSCQVAFSSCEGISSENVETCRRQTVVEKDRRRFLAYGCINSVCRPFKTGAHYAKLPVHRSQLQPRRAQSLTL